MKRMYHQIKDLPTPLGGLALGIASLGWCLENAFPLSGYGQMIGALLAMVLLFFLSARFILHPASIWQDLKHPVLGSILPTFAMASMVISKMISDYFMILGSIIWLCAIVIHIIFLVMFVYHRARQFSWHHVVPSWFIPPIGLIVADVTCPSPEFYSIAIVLLVIGMISYAVMLPLVIYRLIFIAEIPDAAKPTIAILAAPASLSLAGYINIVHVPSLLIIAILLGIAILMTLVVYCALFKLMRLPFSPGFAAFTFPLVIGATALYKVSSVAAHYEATFSMSQQLRVLAHIELLVATLVVLYVAIGYIRHYFNLSETAVALKVDAP